MNPFIEVITVEKLTKEKDSVGTPIEVWSDLCTVRASVKQNPGNRAYDADTQMNSHDFLITFFTRFIVGLNYQCRIRYCDDVYVIKSITPVMRRKGHEIVCLRKLDDGR